MNDLRGPDMKKVCLQKEKQPRVMKILTNRATPEKLPIYFYLTLSLLLILVAFPLITIAASEDQVSSPQGRPDRPQPYYNIDRETTIEGQVEDLKFESRYEGKAHFLILLVKDKKTDEVIEIETAPAWFFQADIHRGERIKLIGALIEDSQGKKMVMAREIKIKNRTIILRDRRGFPAWSGGKGRRRGPDH
jgi:hypothetical protein